MRHRVPRILVLGLSAVLLGAGLGVAPAAAVSVGPLIVGNSNASGNPIETYDFASGGAAKNSFVPAGAAGRSGRGVAIAGNEVFYTELTAGNGPTDAIHVAALNGGAGATTDTRTVPNPDPTTGIAALAYDEGDLFALTGYRAGTLRVYRLDPSDGTVQGSAVAIAAPAHPSSNGFAVLPNGNFLINQSVGSCIYDAYDAGSGAATGTSITVEATTCNGIETDGSSLYVAADGAEIIQLTLAGAFVSASILGPNQLQDIALIRVVESQFLTGLGSVHVWLGLRNSDDTNTAFDVRAELLVNGGPVATGLTRCVTGIARNPTAAKEVVVVWDAFNAVPVNAGDTLTIKLSSRIGTISKDTKCAGHASAVGLRLYYDAATRMSGYTHTSTPAGAIGAWLRSDGNPCRDAESTGVTARVGSSVWPAAATGAAKCKDASAVSWARGNSWQTIGTWNTTL